MGVDVPGWASSGFTEFEPQVSDFGSWVREQAGDLRLERASVDNLAKGGVGGQRKQKAGYVEGAGFEGALVGVGLESIRAGDAATQGFKNLGGGALVGGEEILDGFGI